MSDTQSALPHYALDFPLQSEEQLRLLVEHSRDLFVIADQAGLIQYINVPLLQMLGYLPQDLVNRHDAIQIVHPDDQAFVINKIEALIQNNEIKTSLQFRVRHQDGNWRTLDIEATNLLDNPAVQGIIFNGRDVTESVEAQNKVQQLLRDLRQSNRQLGEERSQLSEKIAEQTAQLRGANIELARALRTRDEFLANMSHELRTPLTSVLGQAELLREGIHGELNSDQDSSVRMIQLSGEHLLALINDILELVKIEAGHAELIMSPVGAETAAVSSAQILQRQAQLKNIDLELPSIENQTYVLADGRRYHQILVNLLSNAIKFTPEGGRVGVDVQKDDEQEAVHVTVWDEGIGIRDEDMTLLFQPFTQLDSSLNRHHEGTGLGLALVYQLTEIQGGSITVESTFGQGSRFTVSLPQAEVEADLVDYDSNERVLPGQRSAKRDNPGTKNSLQPLQILLAEDNADNVDTIVQYLAFRGHNVEVATNGAEAIEMAMNSNPDVIIMDMQMPIVDGLEATRQLRAHDQLAQTPVIALTGLAMPGDQKNCLAAGANAYMSKPISLRKLDSLIHDVIIK